MSKPITSGVIESIYFMSDGRIPSSNRVRWRTAMWSTVGYMFVAIVILAYVYQAINA